MGVCKDLREIGVYLLVADCVSAVEGKPGVTSHHLILLQNPRF